MSDTTQLIPGVCGVVPGSVHPKKTGVEAGLSATGDIFNAIAQAGGQHGGAAFGRARSVQAGANRSAAADVGQRRPHGAGESGIGRHHAGLASIDTAQDELFAAIEGTAFHTRIILERMEKHGVPIHRVINGGGIPQKNEVLNRVYANVLNKPILIPQSDVTSLGSAIFAAMAAKTFDTIEEAQAALCPKHRVIEPDPKAAKVYEELYVLYRDLYFGFGKADARPISVGRVLPALRRIAASARGNA